MYTYKNIGQINTLHSLYFLCILNPYPGCNFILVTFNDIKTLTYLYMLVALNIVNKLKSYIRSIGSDFFV